MLIVTSLQFSMRNAVQRTIVALIFTAIIVVSATRDDSCGTGKSAKRVNYPFGFSSDSPIKLNCSEEGEIKIDSFKVQNVTVDSIFINLPAQCHRGIRQIKPLFGENYGLSRENSLLFQNCSSQSSGCVIPSNIFEERINLKNCNYNISCLAQETTSEIMSFKDVNGTGCAFMLLSMAVDSLENSSVSLELETAQLGWWLSHPCDCARNAKSKNVSLPDGRSGCRCHCDEGFQGSGFRQGDGCQKVSDCDASKYMSGTCGGYTTKIGVLVGGIIAGASLMSTVALICYCIRRRSYLRRRMCEKRLICEAAGNSSVPLYPYKEVERATNGFSEKQRLGTGAYGTVFAGKLHNEEWVAIKKIRNRDESIEQVMNEIKLISSVNHPNLVRLLGCCIERGEQILVYEFMPNGTLSQHLQKERGKGLPWTTRLSIATETAHAIAHLHSAITPPIFHRDIKSSNILLDDNFNSKVADFGLSRLGMTESSHISTAPQGTPGYLDPQYHQNFHLSDRSDVYSFGVVLVEIITAMKVVDFSRPYSEVNLAALAIDRIGRGCVDEIIDPFLEPQRDAWTLSSIHKVAELAFRCLSFHRDMRPSMMEVADELEYIRLSGWAPMEENTYSASSVASVCTSPFNGSEKSLSCISMSVRKAAIGSCRLIVPQRPADCLPSMEVVKDTSPVSVHDPWLSEQSSPSTNSLLGNVVL